MHEWKRRIEESPGEPREDEMAGRLGDQLAEQLSELVDRVVAVDLPVLRVDTRGGRPIPRIQADVRSIADIRQGSRQHPLPVPGSKGARVGTRYRVEVLAI